MIICGFPGTGKSVMAKLSRWVDLESTPFRKNWILYAEVAKHMSDNGYTVMISTHSEVLDALEQIETPYTVVIPHIKDRQTYIRRYTQRGNDRVFCDNVCSHWDEWISAIIDRESVLKTVVILPKDGCIQAWAEPWRGEKHGKT